MSRQTKADKQAQEDAISILRAKLRPGSTVYTILRSVSSSGMSRKLSLFCDSPEGIENITHLVARVSGYKVVDARGHNAITVGGCGMDMGFHVVYNLAWRLFDGTAEHAAWRGLPDAGYMLSHKWL